MNSSKNWVLQVDPKVYKTLRKFPKDYTQRILEVIETLPDDPFVGDIEKMKGTANSWRRRVGSYRVFYDIDQDHQVIVVFRVERRTSKTY